MSAQPTIGKVLDPTILLRVGVGLVLIYAGALALMDTGTLTHFVPVWLGQALPAETVVLVHGVLSLALGAILLVGIWVPAAALFSALDFAGILICYGIDETTFALFGLMFASLALLTLALQGAANAKETAA